MLWSQLCAAFIFFLQTFGHHSLFVKLLRCGLAVRAFTSKTTLPKIGNLRNFFLAWRRNPKYQRLALEEVNVLERVQKLPHHWQENINKKLANSQAKSLFNLTLLQKLTRDLLCNFQKPVKTGTVYTGALIHWCIKISSLKILRISLSQH